MVIVRNVEYLRDLLESCKQRGLNEESMVALTNDSSIPRNVASLYAIHPNKFEMDRLGRNYSALHEELRLANAHNDERRRDQLKQEFAIYKKQIKQLNEQMKDEVFAAATVVFSPRESPSDAAIHFHHDVQLIINSQFYDTSLVLKTLAQVQLNKSVANSFLITN